MSIANAKEILMTGGRIGHSNLTREVVVESNLRWRYIEAPEVKLGHNVGIYNAAGDKILDSDIGIQEIKSFASFSEPVFFLKAKQDNEMKDRLAKGERPLLKELVASSCMIVFPRNFEHKEVTDPALYVVIPDSRLGVTGLMEKLYGSQESTGLAVKTIRAKELDKMMGKYLDVVLGGNRIKRAFRALKAQKD